MLIKLKKRTKIESTKSALTLKLKFKVLILFNLNKDDEIVFEKVVSKNIFEIEFIKVNVFIIDFFYINTKIYININFELINEFIYYIKKKSRLYFSISVKKKIF